MVCRKPVRAALALLAMLGMSTALAQAPLPEQDGRIHEGVASCSNAVCHGRVNRAEDGPVWLNEYRIWLRQDYHSRAYRTLLTDQSKDMAAKLGLPAAHTAKICLDCHADNVPADLRCERFQLDDGVGCEACHGGSELWLESHAEQGTDHRDNIARGLYPTEDPQTRATLCLSCHLGTDSKFPTHDIMGAGHPRLSFELETFSVNQPAHYSVDADYLERKGDVDPVANWLTGLAAGSAQLLWLIGDDAYEGSGLFPELAFFQCHACHHGMDQLRWRRDDAADALGPGSVRLNDGPLLVLSLAMAGLEPELGAQLRRDTRRLHSASLEGQTALGSQARELRSRLQELGDALSRRRFDPEQQRALRRHLLEVSANGEVLYYTAAEQLFLGVETLSIELRDQEALATQLDALFAALDNETQYLPQKFAIAARQMLRAL